MKSDFHTHRVCRLNTRRVHVFVQLAGCLLLVATPAAAQEPPADASSAAAVQLPATVEGYETADLFAKIGGYLHTIAVDIGDRVEADQPLAELEIPELRSQMLQRQSLIEQARAEYRQSEAALGEAHAELDSQTARLEEARTVALEKQAWLDYETAEAARVEQLVEGGAVDSENLDAARFKKASARASLQAAQSRAKTQEAELAKAQAAITRAEADLQRAEAHITVAEADAAFVQAQIDYATIAAPFSGLITKRWSDPGDFIQPALGNSAARPLLRITRTDRVRVVVEASMSQAARLAKGDRAVLARIAGLPDQSFEGRISRLAGSLDPESRTMRVEIDLDNPRGALLPGYFGYVTIYPQ